MLCFLMRWFHWDVETFHRLRRFKGAQIAIMEKQPDGSYRLVSPLPCDPPIPQGVREIASNPVPKPTTSKARKPATNDRRDDGEPENDNPVVNNSLE